MNEIWKDIKNFEGLYQVSNLGRVKCLEHKCPGRYKGKYRTVKEHMMTCVENKTNGYLYVSLSNLDRGRTFTVHRLVANAFIPNPENKPVLNHKDENKHNNCVDNLEWCNAKYNINYSDRGIKFGKTVGCKVIQYSLKGEEIETFYSIGEAARITGLHKTNIYDAVSGKQKTCGGYIWKKAI